MRTQTNENASGFHAVSTKTLNTNNYLFPRTKLEQVALRTIWAFFTFVRRDATSIRITRIKDKEVADMNMKPSASAITSLTHITKLPKPSRVQ